MSTDLLVVNEIFTSIQGESTRAGLPCTFVRLTGCSLRCTWCDTAYAFHEGKPMGLDAILAEVVSLGARHVTVTGGEPLIQAGARHLIGRLCDLGYDVQVETSGAVSTAGLDSRARVILDVKAPGSGESSRNDWSNLERLRATDEIKIVLLDREDYEFARETVRARRLPGGVPVLLSPVHGALDPARLAAWILEDRLPVRLQLQIHKYLWGSDARGV